MTENILYNRIECLSDREEDKRDYTLSLMCKILHMEPRSCSDKDKEKQMEYIISHAANLSPKALLHTAHMLQVECTENSLIT